MFKPERMSKLTVIGPKTVMDVVINKLYSLKIYHIVDHKKTEELDIGSPLAQGGDISDILIKIRALCTNMGIDPAKNEKKAAEGNLTQKEIDSIRRRVEKVHAEFDRSMENMKAADENMRKLDEKRILFERLRLLGVDIDSFTDYSTLSYIVGIMENVKDIGELKRELNKKTSKYEIYHAYCEGKTIIAIFFDVEKKNDIADVLARRGLSEIDVSGIKGLKGDAWKHLSAAKEEMGRWAKEKKAIESAISGLKKNERDFLIDAEASLSAEAEKAEAPLRFASTEKTFVIRGWIPTKKMKSVTDDLDDIAKGRIHLFSEEVKKDEDIPIKLKNPRMIEPFEFFMDMYTLPKYKEIDPTFLMFLTFPLFYGFMLGDVGYGIVTLVLFLYLRTKIKGDMGRLVNAMIFGSISAIIFGCLFGEFFGFEELGGYELMHVLSRYEQMNELMYVAIAIGVVHINIGLLVGFYNELRAHGFRTAFFEKISWMVLEAGVAVIALTYMGYVPLQKWVGFVIVALSIIMIYMGEGAKGIVELPSIFSQTLSYARLMAVGLASVILAVVINDLSGELFHAGIGGIIGGTILLVVGHVINIGLGLISPFLHSLRLHYVEFFTKFYHGGGMRYVPFGTRDEQ
ncbi:hypothetical protein COV19_03285 [Candidatus Woesearchaeota archaeon CG10_big_fil_rev_8_21_14_0_10_44_13]|nr:MAG: hypothetical protein COV19_03285 [Candidatus Woesearchaeota archaeon CG10_big_fil_rev_8_21_14_0_10_44_13]